MIKSIVSIYTFLHFLVDFACAYLIYHFIYPLISSPTEVFFAFFLYNFFAFAVQFPIGILADFVNKNSFIAGLGCFLVALAFLLYPLGIIAIVIAGFGNACFHVGGGINILNISKGKAALPGIFVSSGALGIFLGAQKFLNLSDNYLIFIGLLGMGCLFLYFLHNKFQNILQNPPVQTLHLSKLKIFMIFCLCLTVFLRSYTGFMFAFEWKQGFVIGLLFTGGILLGKMLGGIISDKFGMQKTAIMSLILSALFCCFAFQNNIYGIIFGSIGVLLFNMTMPLTLTALTNLIPTQKGMAFGLLTFMLFLGALPTLFNMPNLFFSPKGLCLLIFLSLISLVFGLPKGKKES